MTTEPPLDSPEPDYVMREDGYRHGTQVAVMTAVGVLALIALTLILSGA